MLPWSTTNTLGYSALFRVLAPPCLIQQWLRSALALLQGTSALRNCSALRFCVLRDNQGKSSTRRRSMEGWNNKKIDVTPRAKFRPSQRVLGRVTLGWLPMVVTSIPRGWPETKHKEWLLWTCVAESSWSQINYVPWTALLTFGQNPNNRSRSFPQSIRCRTAKDGFCSTSGLRSYSSSTRPMSRPGCRCGHM